MEHTLVVWGSLIVVWVGGLAMLADSRRHVSPDSSLGVQGSVGVVIIAGCLVAFFITAAIDFGQVVWIIPMLAFWAFLGWLVFDQVNRRA